MFDLDGIAKSEFFLGARRRDEFAFSRGKQRNGYHQQKYNEKVFHKAIMVYNDKNIKVRLVTKKRKMMRSKFALHFEIYYDIIK